MARSLHNVTLHCAPAGAAVTGNNLRQIGERNLEHLLNAAREEGLQQGRSDARESGQEALEQATIRLEEARERAEADLPPLVVELSIEIAKQILKVEIAGANYDLERIVRGALSDADVGRGACTVHVAPEDAARLEGIPWRAGTVVEADPTMGPGDIHISTPKGLLVRELDSTLDAIREQLWEELV